MIIVLVFLGTWQVLRANEKESLQQQYDLKNALPEVRLKSLLSGNEDNDFSSLVFRKVYAHGELLSEYAFFVDNVILDGKTGYLLHTPLRLEDGKIILVNQGWLPAGKTRGHLPEIESLVGKVALNGMLVEPRSKPVLLGDLPKPNMELDKLWFYVDLSYLEDQMKAPVLPWVLELSPQDPLSKQVKTTIYDAKVGMHIGYAIQWYVFILFVLIGYLAMTVRKR